MAADEKVKQQEEALEQMKELVETLNQASKAYYQEDRELMSNQKYDQLYDQLLALEKESGVVLAGSPTVSVGYEALDELPKEAHEIQIGRASCRERVSAVV